MGVKQSGTYVAPATTNSVAFARVDTDKTAMNMLAAVTIMTSRAVRLSTQLHTMTGARSKVTMNGVIKNRAARVMDACGMIWTLGSLETPNFWSCV